MKRAAQRGAIASLYLGTLAKKKFGPLASNGAYLTKRLHTGVCGMGDIVEQAAKAAESQYPAGRWGELSPRERAAAIYTEMRRLDAEKVASAPQEERRV